MNAPRAMGPLRVRESLKRHSTVLYLPPESLQSEGDISVLIGPGRWNGAGLTLSGGEAGLARVLGEAVVGTGAYAEPEEGAADTCYRVRLPRAVWSWISDPVLVWRMLAAVHGPGQVEVSLVAGGELNRAFHTPGETVWHCRAGDLGWIVVESDGQDERALARGLQDTRDILRGTGMPRVEIRMERSPPSVMRQDVRLLRLATPRWTAWWPLATLNKLLGRVVGGEAGAVPGDSLSTQRAAAVRICDHLLRAEGISGLSLVLPRTTEERRGRYALRTVRELLRAGGVGPRTLAESSYRSGTHYQALVSLAAGLHARDREILRRALGRRRWEQVLDHSTHRVPALMPWVDFSQACETLVRDLADRARRPGSSPPAAVNDLIRRFYSDPREERLREAWRAQIKAGALARALEDARLSLLRPLLRQLPRAVLVQAGCGETQEVKMRISSGYSRRGRRMYLEDVAVLEARLERHDFPPWDELLAARMTLRAAALRATGSAATGRQGARRQGARRRTSPGR